MATSLLLLPRLPSLLPSAVGRKLLAGLLSAGGSRLLLGER